MHDGRMNGLLKRASNSEMSFEKTADNREQFTFARIGGNLNSKLYHVRLCQPDFGQYNLSTVIPAKSMKMRWSYRYPRCKTLSTNDLQMKDENEQKE